jgi:hypothetical protein
MRRKLTTLRAKQGGAQNGNGNGNPRQTVDHAVYRERANARAGATPLYFDSEYSGWSHATRPRDQAISLRSPGVTGPTAPTGPTGPFIG